MILQKAHEWGLASIVFKRDIAKAFDAMEHPLLDRSFAARSVPFCLRAATLRELRSRPHLEGTASVRHY